jgi:hypothetical protein
MGGLLGRLLLDGLPTSITQPILPTIPALEYCLAV